jgi:hypothetical protein
MAALSKDRDTPTRSGDRRSFAVKGGVILYAGAMVAIDGSGRLQPGRSDATLKGVGRCPVRVDNSTGADGAVHADVEAGVHRFGNSSGGDAIAVGDIGSTAYMVDDQTVAKTDASGTRGRAGTIFDVDALGVWIKFS